MPSLAILGPYVCVLLCLTYSARRNSNSLLNVQVYLGKFQMPFSLLMQSLTQRFLAAALTVDDAAAAVVCCRRVLTVIS